MPGSNHQAVANSSNKMVHRIWMNSGVISTRKLGQIFGGKGGPQAATVVLEALAVLGADREGLKFQRSSRIWALVLSSGRRPCWCGWATGFFIVQEGQQAVITQFGKYHSTVGGRFQLAHALSGATP